MEQTIQNFYPVKVWLATNVSGTFFLLLGFIFSAGTGMRDIADAMPIVLYIFFFGLLFSVPALGLFWVLFLWIKRLDMGISGKKAILIGGGMVMILLTFFIITSDLFSPTNSTWLVFPGAYSAALAFSVWLIHLYKTPRLETDFAPEPGETI